jgi:hypothetical protein
VHSRGAAQENADIVARLISYDEISQYISIELSSDHGNRRSADRERHLVHELPHGVILSSTNANANIAVVHEQHKILQPALSIAEEHGDAVAPPVGSSYIKKAIAIKVCDSQSRGVRAGLKAPKELKIPLPIAQPDHHAIGRGSMRGRQIQ